MNTPYFQLLLKENRLPTPHWDNKAENFISPIQIASTTRFGTIIIPKGFEWDGMSWLKKIWGKQGWPSAWHDFIYRMQPEGWTQEMADLVFFDLMVEAGISKTVARVRYLGLRLGGWYAWWRNKKRYAEDREKFQREGLQAFIKNCERYEKGIV